MRETEKADPESEVARSEPCHRTALGLPVDAFQWCFAHGLVIDPRKPLKIYEVVVVFEVAYGLPMLLLAGLGGALAMWLRSRPDRRSLPEPS
jgi:hypothetical protein